jgi:uncharacterized membrane protein YgcG
VAQVGRTQQCRMIIIIIIYSKMRVERYINHLSAMNIERGSMQCGGGGGQEGGRGGSGRWGALNSAE